MTKKAEYLRHGDGSLSFQPARRVTILIDELAPALGARPSILGMVNAVTIAALPACLWSLGDRSSSFRHCDIARDGRSSSISMQALPI